MTSSYGIGGKPYMGPIGGGGWQVGPHVLDPAGANGSKPVDATATRPSTDKFEKPKPSTAKAPKPPTGVQGNRMASGGWLGHILGGGFRLWDATKVVNPNLSDRDRGIAATGVIHPLLGSAMQGLSWIDDRMTELTGVSSSDPLVSGRGAGHTAFKNNNPAKIRTIEPPKAVPDNPNDDWADPIAGPGPADNPVGYDADPDTPGLQGSGAPGANPYEPGTKEHGMFIWAKKYKGMAEDVLDKVENRGLKQAGYEQIREALGKTPATPPASVYETGTGLTAGEIEAPDLKSDVKYDPDFKVDYSQNPQGFLSDKISLLTTSASSLQQPNFDGSSQPIGGDSPKDSQPEQDFNNANTNPAEVVPTTYHPLNIKPSEEAEKANAEYGAMKFQFDPAKNMMVRIK